MEIRPLISTDRLAWSQLVATCFDRTPADMEKLWCWLNQDERLLAWGAWSQGKLIAQYSCLRQTIALPMDCAPVGMSINMAVHPEFRGRGLVKQLAEPLYARLAEMGFAAGVGFSNAAGVVVDRQSKGYGYTVVGRLDSVVVPLIGRFEQRRLCLTDTLPPPTAETLFQQPALSFVADAAWVRWRFAEHPFRRYQYGVWQDGARLRGVVVYRTTQRHGLRGVSLLGAYGDHLDGLLLRWLNSVQQKGARFVHLLASPNSELLHGLANGRFSLKMPFSRSPHYLTVKPLHPQYADLLLDYQRWHCVGGQIL